MRGLFAISSIKGKSHDLHEKKWYISATLLYWLNLLVRCWWAEKIIVTMKKNLFLLFAIVSVVGMMAISGCKKTETYTVTFNANGGAGTMEAQTFTEGEAQALTRNAFTYDSYTFTGWNTVQGGSGASYTDGQTITATADMTLYAQWIKQTKEITIDWDWWHFPSKDTVRKYTAQEDVKFVFLNLPDEYSDVTYRLPGEMRAFCDSLQPRFDISNKVRGFGTIIVAPEGGAQVPEGHPYVPGMYESDSVRFANMGFQIKRWTPPTGD